MKKWAIAALLLLPSVAFGAGFAKDPIFLSRSPVTEGQSVHVYAVLSNTDTTTFAGTVMFYDGTSKLGSVSVNLAAGGSQTVSIVWTPTAGSHTIKADLVGSNSSVAEEISSDFSVAPKTQPGSSNSAATIDSSAGIQQGIAGISPQVASTTAPVFMVIDGARNSAADALDSQIASTKAKLSSTPKPGIVAGASIGQDAQIQNGATGIWYWLYTIYLWILEALRWLVGSAGIFYPFLAIIFLYILWRLYRRFRRPRY